MGEIVVGGHVLTLLAITLLGFMLVLRVRRKQCCECGLPVSGSSRCDRCGLPVHSECMEKHMEKHYIKLRI
ncbi:MAG: hypothetical protein QXT92_00080 [Nitrososphaerota archaeon]